MGTTIKITPPGGSEYTVRVYEKCRVELSATDRAGSFSLSLPDDTGELVDLFPVGSEVSIVQDDAVFRGWVKNPPKIRQDRITYIDIDGLDHTARTQKILVTESYTDTRISDIVLDLFSKYAPQYDTSDVMDCDKQVTIKFPDVFLWDAMEQLAELAGYEWYINAKLPEEIPQIEPTGWTEEVNLVLPAEWGERSGWFEQLSTRSVVCPWPSDALYPGYDLYPC